MQLQIISIGQKMPQWVDTACDDYIKRLPRELSIQWTTLPLAQRKAKDTADRFKQQEAELIKQKISSSGNGSYNLALDEHGKHWNSQDWAKQLQQWMQEYPKVNLIIGGPDGLSNSLRQSCHQTVSFGAMTMPHALVRVVLIEQLYRAWAITKSHPYHRE